ncbi:MAG: DUF4347 domain-containing protein [Pseudomonadota bacterium]
MKRISFSSPSIVEALEPRILYSADLSPLVAAFDQDAAGLMYSSCSTTTSFANFQQNSVLQDARQNKSEIRHEIVFIDMAVSGYEQLAISVRNDTSATRSVEVMIIDTQQDGIAQITAALSTHQNVDAIHIISHGDPGEIQIGDTRLNSQNLLGNAVSISTWGNALADGSDILLYGCDVAATSAGRDFVSSLGQLTGADVAASTDLTGEKNLGGNWLLEYAAGKIESSTIVDAVAQADFHSVLATYTVTNTANSGAGSLRQAIINANANAGTDAISFSIGSGSQTIALTSALPTITGRVAIDGTSQTGYASTPLIELNGASAGANVDGLTLTSGAAGSTITGLIINRFTSDGIYINGSSSITVQGNYIGTDASSASGIGNTGNGINVASSTNITIGGTTVATRNVISGNTGNGIMLSGGNGYRVTGNYIGTNVAGTAALGNEVNGVDIVTTNNSIIGSAVAGGGNLISGNTTYGIRIHISTNNLSVQGNYIGLNATGTSAIANGTGIESTSNAYNVTIGGTTAAERNVISGNTNRGIFLAGSSTGFNIKGNYVGLNATGSAAVGNGGDGVRLNGADGNTIGGTAVGAGNIISGNGTGISMPNGSNNIIQGNYIGTNAAGTAALGNTAYGLDIYGSSSRNTVGGTVVGAGNIISGNVSTGINIASSTAKNNSILGNSIYSNGGLGINLGGASVTANDVGDVDTGGNDLQNFPVLTSAYSNSARSLVNGTLTSNASSTFRIEFFGNLSTDSTGYGEGETYLGFVNVITGVSGSASFSATLAGLPSSGQWISATATDQTTGDTSEFAFGVQAIATNNPPAGTNNVLSTVEDQEYTFTASDFGFSDSADAPTNNFISVKITTVPSAGTLTNNGIVANAGNFVTKADIDLGRLVFTPSANANGSGYASFTFQVQDDGGVSNGGVNLDVSANTIRMNVTAVNDVPVNAVPNTARLVDHDTQLTFSAANGNSIVVADIDADSLQVTLSVTNGTLTLTNITRLSFSVGSGTTDAAMVFSGAIADINSALNGLQFTPAANFNGSANLIITSADHGASGAGGEKSAVSMVSISGLPRSAPILMVLTTLPVTSTTTEPASSEVLLESPSITPSESTDSENPTNKVDGGASATATNSGKPTVGASKIKPAPTILGSDLQNANGMDALQGVDNTRTILGSNTTLTRSDAVLSFDFIKQETFINQSQSNLSVFNESDSLVTSIIRRPAVLASSAVASSLYADNAILFQGVPTEKLLREFAGMSEITVEAVGIFLSLSSVWMFGGKSALAASLVASMPTWGGMDPLYVLTPDDAYGVDHKLDKIDYIFGAKSTSLEPVQEILVENFFIPEPGDEGALSGDVSREQLEKIESRGRTPE